MVTVAAACLPIFVGLRTQVKDFSTLTPVSRGEKEVMTTSERAHSCNNCWWVAGGVAVFSLFWVASTRSTLGVSHEVTSVLGGVEKLRLSSSASKWDSLWPRDSMEVLPSSSELML